MVFVGGDTQNCLDTHTYSTHTAHIQHTYSTHTAHIQHTYSTHTAHLPWTLGNQIHPS